MIRTLTRILWVLAGLLLAAAGVFCLLSPAAALSGVAAYLGIAMLISGVVDIVIFAAANRYMAGSGWFLADGILTVLIAVFILGNQTFTALALPFAFGIWLLFSGVSKFAGSLALRRLGIPGWGWFAFAGIALAVLGFLSFVNPAAGAAAISVMVGLDLIFEGAASILRGCFARRFWL